jgi:RimJ/RimL family protein N-acetyltransferase
MHRRTPHRTAPRLETDRLVLREFRLEDFERSYEITADAAVHRHLGGAPSRTVKWEKFLRSPTWWAWLGYGMWLAEERATGRVVGEIGFGEFERDIDPRLPDLPEMGWIFAAETHGRGLAGEALRAALAWGDAELGCGFQCIVAEANAPSLRLADRHGFVEVRRAPFNGRADDPVVVLERPAARS